MYYYFSFKLFFLLFVFLKLFLCVISNYNNNKIIFLIITQPSKYHETLAKNLLDDLNKQINSSQIKVPVVFHEINDFEELGAWTFIPLFELLHRKYGNNFGWIIFCEERTHIDFNNLLSLINKHDADKKLWFARELYDREPTIIHHFAFYENPTFFKYPNAASGFLISRGLFKHIILYISKITRKTDFSIDASHELALFIWNSDKTLMLTNDDNFCVTQQQNCITYLTPFKQCDSTMNYRPKSILFAVKTFKLYHNDRISVIKKTWARFTDHIMYFSNELDETIPTIKLNVTNVDKGHCEKTKNILNYLSEKIRNRVDVDWIVIADDDTIISISRLHAFLTCFSPTEYFVIGQRYGYGVTADDKEGFNYVTGGGGIVINRLVLEKLTRPGVCDCPSPTTPDDMYIFGLCLSRWDIPIVHSSMFHQARPTDYPPDYLRPDPSISFHKHWMIDPIQLYKDWFETDDEKWFMKNFNQSNSLNDKHEEF